jgi:ankyrin repeat protein
MQLDDERKAQLGFDIDARESAGRTPLMLAAEHNSVRMVESLLDCGANPLLTSESPWSNQGGWNVFHW